MFINLAFTAVCSMVFLFSVPSAGNVNPTGPGECQQAHDQGVERVSSRMIGAIYECENARKYTDKNCLDPKHQTGVPVTGGGGIPGRTDATESNLARAWGTTYYVGKECEKSMKKVYQWCKNAPNQIEREAVRYNNPCDRSNIGRVQTIKQGREMLHKWNETYQDKIGEAADQINAQLNALSVEMGRNAGTRSSASPGK